MGILMHFLQHQKTFEYGVVEDDFTRLFKVAVQDRNNLTNTSATTIPIYKPTQFSIEFQAKINTFLLDKKVITTDLFRCAIYIARMIEKKFDSVPISYYAVDYYIDGFSTQKPALLLEGADLCCMICLFFPERGNRRSMKLQDYEHMGVQLYYRYHEETQNTIGLCMGDNFNSIVGISKECLQEI